jgi:hypothetical protein
MKLNILALSLCIFLFSCDDDSSQGNKIPESSLNTFNDPACVLNKSTVYFQDKSRNTEYIYEINDLKTILESSSSGLDTINFEIINENSYSSTDGQLESIFVRENMLIKHFIIGVNSDTTLYQQWTISDGLVDKFEEFNFNLVPKLETIYNRYEDSVVVDYYEYDLDDKILERSDVFSDFDNKNPIYNGRFNELFFSSNYRKVVNYVYDFEGNRVKTGEANRTLEYNSKGFPTFIRSEFTHNSQTFINEEEFIYTCY